jgi:hypothetical protein
MGERDVSARPLPITDFVMSSNTPVHILRFLRANNEIVRLIFRQWLYDLKDALGTPSFF